MAQLVRITLCGILVLSWFVSAASDSAAGADESSESGRPRVVMATGCPILLINDVQLASQRPGVLEFVEPNEGDTVRAGHQVARLKDGVARASAEMARLQSQDDIEVRYAREANGVDIAEYRSALAANRLSPGTIPDIELQRLELTAKRSALQIEKAQHDLEIKRIEYQGALEELKTYQIEAPFDGIVTKIYKKQGEAVQQGEVILEMVNTRIVKVEGWVDIRDATDVTPGALVQIRVVIPNVDLEIEKRVFEGRVRFVDVRVSEVQGGVRIWADVINQEDLLKDGMRADMKIFCTQSFAREASSRESNAVAPPGRARPDNPRSR